MYLSTDQVAERFGVCPRTIKRMAASGKLPQPLILGERLLRWPLAELEQWERERREQQQLGRSAPQM